MRPEQIELGAEYRCRLEHGVVRVRVDSAPPAEDRRKGWIVTDVESGRQEHVARHEQFRAPWVPDPDPSRCVTANCANEPAMTYLGNPLCQACWEATTRTTNESEETMATKTASKKATKKTPAAKPPKTPKPQPDAAEGEAKPKRISALDAAAEVLKARKTPANCTELIAEMAERGLWSSPNGKTPAATLYAAILREIGTKGGEARFKKIERGQFEYAG